MESHVYSFVSYKTDQDNDIKESEEQGFKDVGQFVIKFHHLFFLLPFFCKHVWWWTDSDLRLRHIWKKKSKMIKKKEKKIVVIFFSLYTIILSG